MKVKRDARGFPRRGIFKRRASAAPSDALLWTRDITGGCARVTAIGASRLLVENHTGILEVSEARVRLDTGCGPITVTGRGLTLQDVRRCALIVRGEIRRVELPCGRGGDAT